MSKAGRKGKYDPDVMPKLTEEYAREGYLDKQIAEMLGIRADTFCKWQRKHEQLGQALKRGREVANIELKRAMLKTAAGYDVEEEETTAILDKNKQPKSYRKTVRKRRIPPSTTMQIFLAKNRMPDEFRDVNRHEITGANGAPVQITTNYDLSALSEEELTQLRGILVKASAKDTPNDSRD